jgi:hypothetical protein
MGDIGYLAFQRGLKSIRKAETHNELLNLMEYYLVLCLKNNDLKEGAHLHTLYRCAF